MEMKALLFDLGGVLVDWDGVAPIVKLSGGEVAAEKARTFWLESVWVRTFETGKCTAEAFAAGCVEELGLDISPNHFIDEFARWDRGPFCGALELLNQLSNTYPLYCLSNNNCIHWQNQGTQSLTSRFEKVFVSFETGLVKPDRGAFLNVLGQVPEEAPQILFFDDNQECVEAAIELGFQARKVNGLPELRQTLASICCLRN